MITFHDGSFDAKKANSTVLVNGKEHDSLAVRNEAGDIAVTFDFDMHPENGDPVTFVNRVENDSTYVGTFSVVDNVLTFN